MRLKPEHLQILESLLNKPMLQVKYDTEPTIIQDVRVYYLSGWKVEDIPAKKGWFGHGPRSVLKEIHVKTSEDINTRFHGVFTAGNFLDLVMWKMQRDRKLFISLNRQLKEFGIELPETLNHADTKNNT